MRVKLRYGRTGVEVELPERNVVAVLRMNPTAPLADPVGAVREALRHPIGARPLRELAQGCKSACIVTSDITRPVPNPVILPPILAELEAAGVAREGIAILVGTGIHRANEGAELVEMFGEEIVRSYRVLNHVARDPESHTFIGRTKRGTPIEVDSRYLEADLKIVTGLIEPHLMAGYSGGRKGICPGICSTATMKVMHGPHLLDSPLATYGIIEGNPFHEEATEIAERAGVDFLLNVTLDEQRRITGIFAGDLKEAFASGVAFAEKSVKVAVPREVDVVLTSSAGYPLDTTYYQAIKGIKAALPILRAGGSVVIAAECAEGLGGPEFTELLMTMPDLQTFERKMWEDGFFVLDQWQLQELVISARQAEVLFFSDRQPPRLRERLLVEWVPSPEAGVARALERHGADASIAVVPEGPYVLPALA